MFVNLENLSMVSSNYLWHGLPKSMLSCVEFEFCMYSSYYFVFVKTTYRGYIILIVYVTILLFQAMMIMEYKGLRHDYNPILT